MAVDADDVVFVGEERDCDCLCLGEDKASKQRRLLLHKKSLESRKESDDSVDEIVATKPKGRRHSSECEEANDNSRGQSQGEQEAEITMQFLQPVAGSCTTRHQLGNTATPSSTVTTSNATVFIPSNSQHPSATMNGETSSYGSSAGLETRVAVSSGSSSTSTNANFLDFPNSDWINKLSTSDWDSILNLPASSAEHKELATTPTIGAPNHHTPSGSVMSPQTPMRCSQSVGEPGAGNISLQNASVATPPEAAVPQSSGAPGFTGCFVERTEKDSATHSQVASQSFCDILAAGPSTKSTNGAPVVGENSCMSQIPSLCSNSFSSTHYQTVNAYNTPLNPGNRNQRLMPIHSPSAPQSSSHSVNVIRNSLPQTLPANSYQVRSHHQQEQGYTNAGMDISPKQAPSTHTAPVEQQVPVFNGVQPRQQQSYPSPSPIALTPVSTINQPTPVNSVNNGMAFNFPANCHVQLSPTQLQMGYGTSQQQIPFSAGAIQASMSNPQVTFGNGVQGFSANFAGGPVRPPVQPLPSNHPSTAGSIAATHLASHGTEHLQNDEQLARKLQEEEYLKGMRRSRHGDERLAMSLLANDLSIGQARNSIMPNRGQYLQQQLPPLPAHQPPDREMQTVAGPSSTTNTGGGEPVATLPRSDSEAFASYSEQQVSRGPQENAMKHPTCWTECPNCSSDVTRKYHLIDVECGSPEWNVVTEPLYGCGFKVVQVQRIQNETLWQRLCFEKQLMLRDRRSSNEKLLYHTSRADVGVICEEGLDPRLSRNGLFGSGIYFSDNPIKCDKYWSNKWDSERIMFCCRVLLGDTKVYPRGKSEQLKREPPKENPQPGEPKTYDSVQGNISGQDEFVVYNAYRVMPEYVIKYHGGSDAEYVPPVSGYHHVSMRFRRLRKVSLARRVSVQFPSTSPYPAVYHSPPLPPSVCPHQRTLPPPGSIYGGPSNYYPMPVPDVRSPALHCQTQTCFGIQPMLQSRAPPMPYPPKSS